MAFQQYLAALGGLLCIAIFPTPCSTVNCVCFERIAEGMVNPLVLQEPKDGSGRLFITTQDGFIYIYYRNGSRLEQPFLDVSDKLSNLKSRARGLIGTALHPNFVENKRLFIYYTTKPRNKDAIEKAVLSEIRVSEDDPNIADPNFERVMIEMVKFSSIHNGGQILFDSKDYLYLFAGDGDVQGNPRNTGQDKSALLGSVLRLDVSDPDVTYKIPPDNPYINDPEARPEIYVIGIRCAFSAGIDRGDRITGEGKDRIFFGDVGRSKNEELSFIAPNGGGSNYGWRHWEGTFCTDDDHCNNITNYIPPVVNYGHNEGNAVIGGKFYRGCRYPGLNGVYFYGDHGFGRMWSLTEDNTQPSGWLNENLNVCTDCEERGFLPWLGGHVYGFEEDAAGEMYLLSALTSRPTELPPGGRVWKFIDPSTHDTHTECSPTILLPWPTEMSKQRSKKCKPDRSSLDDGKINQLRAMWEERWFYDTAKFPKVTLTPAQELWWNSLADYFPPGRVTSSGGKVDQTEQLIALNKKTWEMEWFNPDDPELCLTQQQQKQCPDSRKKRAPTSTKPVPTLDPLDRELIQNASDLFDDWVDHENFPATNLTAKQKLYLEGVKLNKRKKNRDRENKKPGRDCVRIHLPAFTRIEWRRMSDDMRLRFIQCLKNLAEYYPDPKRKLSAYDIFVKMHRVNNSPGAQRGASLLPWHRELLWRFSNALRRMGYFGELPYWDPALDSELPDPSCSALWTKTQLGVSDGDVMEPFNFLKPIKECGGKLMRQALKGKKGKKLLYTKQKIEKVLAKACFNDLTWGWDPEFESYYNDVHAFFGPMKQVQMADPNCAANDPAFWLLVAYIDLIWEKYRIYEQGISSRELEYPRTKLGKLPAAMWWHSDMRPFGTKPNIAGLSDSYTRYYYSYEDHASFITCKSNKDCDTENSGLLWCDVKRGRCIAKMQEGCACKKDWPNQQCWCPKETSTPRCISCVCKCKG